MIASRTCTLGPISILASQEIQQQAKSLLATPGDLQAIFDAHNRQRGVPTIVEEVLQQPRILLAVSGVMLVVAPAGEGASFAVIELRPLRLPEQDRFAREALWVRTAAWQIADARSLKLNRDAKSTAAALLCAWHDRDQGERRAAIATPMSGAAAERERFLDRLEALIALARRLEQDRLLANGGQGSAYAYGQVEATGEAGRFLVRVAPGVPRPRARERVRVRSAPNLRGTVLGMMRGAMLVEIPGVSLADIPPDGALEALPSLAQYNAQREAVATLRAGGSRNQRLLDVLVQQTYQALPKGRRGDAPPPAELDPDQAAAWRAAQAVPDALLVLGPPGTGKTFTITHIARTLAAAGQRILVTAKTHRAVDNALERLSAVPGLRIVRAGQDDRIAPAIQDLLLGNQARNLRAAILAHTAEQTQAFEAAFALLGDGRQLTEAARSDDHLAQLEGELTTTLAMHGAALAAIDRRYGVPIRLWETELAADAQRLRQMDHELAALAERRAEIATKSRRPLIGVFWRVRGARLDRRIARHRTRRERFSGQLVVRAAPYLALRQAHALALASPDLESLASRRDALRAALSTATAGARAWLARLDAALAPLIAARPAFDPLAGGSPRAYIAWARGLVPTLHHQARIAAEWREALRADADALIPILLENADVVGATCIGVATTRDLPDEEFDLVIADEAGQIGLPDLLVPLVRARRAILVGDHHQLPPFVADEVNQWLADHASEQPGQAGVRNEGEAEPSPLRAVSDEVRQVTDLLTKSAFERLFPAADPAHRVWLTHQKRMPRVIADFIATHFYGGQLHTQTDTPPPASAPLFPQPLTLIDTSDQPRATRAESAAGGRNGDAEGGPRGFSNEAEATIIAGLVTAYDQADLDWVVITPYQAQAERIRALLGQRLAPERAGDLGARVATVDSFQGGERDYVFFSFTRSNQNGQIGFLKELRRLNVTMSRARRQLVMVGDVATLTAAQDKPFQQLARALVEHASTHGERVRSSDVSTRLAAWRPEASVARAEAEVAL